MIKRDCRRLDSLFLIVQLEYMSSQAPLSNDVVVDIFRLY